MPSLECGICGGPAIEREENLFYEDEGEKCMTCGFPGSVQIADMDEEGEHAYWACDEIDANYDRWILEDPERARRLGYE